MDISVEMVMRLYQIFQSKDWSTIEGNTIVFENFCNLLTNLKIEQRDLIFELIDRYTWISFREYQNRLISVLNSIEKEKIDSYKKIYLFPIMKPEDEDTTKSGHTILYMIKSILPGLPMYRTKALQYIESYKLLSEDKLKLKDDECIMLLDDYLGSGETIQATIDEILKNSYIKVEHLNIISIASQRSTIEIIEKNNIAIYSNYVAHKGISDYYSSPTLEEKIETMLDIEKMIPGGSHFSFGYNQSEALITMLRTPDNTFPIFWKNHRKEGKMFEAPFSRV